VFAGDLLEHVDATAHKPNLAAVFAPKASYGLQAHCAYDAFRVFGTGKSDAGDLIGHHLANGARIAMTEYLVQRHGRTRARAVGEGDYDAVSGAWGGGGVLQGGCSVVVQPY